jgi:hypothetical protein
MSHSVLSIVVLETVSNAGEIRDRLSPKYRANNSCVNERQQMW